MMSTNKEGFELPGRGEEALGRLTIGADVETTSGIEPEQLDKIAEKVEILLRHELDAETPSGVEAEFERL